MTSIQRTADAVQVKTGSRFDFAACEALQSAFEAELAKGLATLTIDLAGTNYIDSAALGMLLYMDHVCDADVDVQVVGARGQVLDAIKKIHIDQVLNVRH